MLMPLLLPVKRPGKRHEESMSCCKVKNEITDEKIKNKIRLHYIDMITFHSQCHACAPSLGTHMHNMCEVVSHYIADY